MERGHHCFSLHLIEILLSIDKAQNREGICLKPARTKQALQREIRQSVFHLKANAEVLWALTKVFCEK